MPRWQRIYLAACAGVIGYALAYTLSSFGRWRRLTYFQYAHRWKLVAHTASRVPSNYVGTVLWGVGGAAVGAAATWGVTRFLGRELDRRWLRLAGAWALAAFALAVAYFTWNLWPF